MIKVWLCAIAKLENVYLREWVEYYKNLGIDKIVLCDNNNVDGERFETVISDYIESGFVIVKDYRGKRKCQSEAYFKSYYKYINQFDWMAFFDIDEFLQIDSGKKIYEEINDYNDFDCVRVCWQNYDDNNLIKVENDNYSVNRFTNKIKGDNQSKSILKTKLNLNFLSSHGYNNSLNTCNSEGIKCNVKNTTFNYIDKISLNKMSLNHYRLKTIDEFIRFKSNRGDFYKDYKNSIDYFWKFNNKTTEKENFLNAQNILVSVICLTYNHEKYIKQCLDGFINQKTNFAFEVFVHDDCSTDGTAKIIKEYANKYPNIIKPLFENKNRYSSEGPKFVIFEILNMSKGKYIGECEGDDYWIDEYKLQKQVDFLEKHNEFIACSHRFIEYDENNNKFIDDYLEDDFNGNYYFTYTLEMHIKKWRLKGFSTVYRKDKYLQIDLAKYSYNNGFDSKIFYEFLRLGNFAILNFYGGIYRRNNSGVYGNKSIKEKLTMGIKNCKDILYFYPEDKLMKEKLKGFEEKYKKLK